MREYLQNKLKLHENNAEGNEIISMQSDPRERNCREG